MNIGVITYLQQVYSYIVWEETKPILYKISYISCPCQVIGVIKFDKSCYYSKTIGKVFLPRV